MQNSRPVRSGTRAGRIFGVILGLLGVGLLVNWWLLVREDPEVPRPVVVLPRPNAYDLYIAAGNARVSARQIDAITKKPTAPTTPEEEKALEQIEAAIRLEAPALKLLHEGMAYQYCNPPSTPGTVHLEFSVFRGLARLVAMQSRVRAARGDWGGAADSALDAIRIGEDLPRGGQLIEGLVGIACESIGQRPAWESVDHLNAAQSRAAIQRLQAIMDRHVSFSDVMQGEIWYGQADLKKTLRAVNARNALSKVKEFGYDEQTPASDRYRAALYLLYGKNAILRNYTTYMKQLVVLGRQPYGLHLPPPTMPTDPVNQAFLPVFAQARLSFVKTEMMNDLLLVALALHAYRLDHGHAAASLAELTPTYLPKLPDDPFAVEGTFQYHLKGTDFVLYSIGPDGKDDDGIPIDKPQNANSGGSRARYRVDQDSLGDIVAGINYP